MRLSSTLLALALPASGLAAVEAPDAPPVAERNPDSGLRIGGYGIVHYNNFAGEAKNNQIDIHRFVLAFEYDFDARTSFVGEVEIEHALAGDGAPGEVEVEQAYIQWQVNPEHAVRGGVMLVPASRLNLYHEPPVFHGVERPYTEKRLIPTTWWEGGVQAHGTLSEDFTYWAMLSSSLNQNGFDNQGIRGGRQKTANADAEGLMFSGRVEWQPVANGWVGASLIAAQTNQTAGSEVDGFLTQLVLEGGYDWQGLELSGTFVTASLDESQDISAANGDPVGEQMTGGYITAAYDIMPHVDSGSDQYVAPFVRYEYVDTMASTDGVPSVDGTEVEIYQIGVTWKPRPDVAVKFDYQDWENDADSATDQWNLGIGWMF